MAGQTIAGAEAPEQAAAFFARFSTIVLVGNSEAMDVSALRRDHADDTLFVFFNKTYKVLSQRFDGISLLVARSGTMGANIVYRREVPQVLAPLRDGRFCGILNIRVGGAEVFSPASDFGIGEVGLLDLAPTVAGFYPSTHLPTTGFALALFLSEAVPNARIVLAGFTARRSVKWKLFYDHDWTFEQIALRLMRRSGRIEMTGALDEASPLAAIARRFPDISPDDVALTAAEVLTERVETANVAIDKLMGLTRLQGRVDGWLRSLKPATRKQRQAAKDAAPKG
jgi:hypothetical protein